MDLMDHPPVSFDDLLRSMQFERATPDAFDERDLSNQSQADNSLSGSDLVEQQTIQTPASTTTDSFFVTPAQPDSSFEMLSGPMLAFEPATPFDDYFHTPNISASSRALSQIQSNFEHILTPGFHQHTQFDPSQRLDHGFDFVSSPLSSQASVFGSPHFQSEAGSFGGFGLPIARRHQRHHRDLSGDSSLASSASSLLFDNPQAIDPTALAPPLAPPPTAPVISPFINQTVEQGPDGTITGRYQRPLTSTGRPSHARKTPPGHVKRPRNAFILFRSHACAANLIPPTVEKDHRQISRIVSHMWRDLPAEERGRWEREAEQEKELHRRLHPDYRYKPVYRKDTPAKKKSPISRRKPAHRKTPVSETSPPSTTADEDERSPSEREQSRDEALRCEAVARVVMEVKLSGATLDEGQIEARVSEEIRNVRQQHQQKKPQGIIPTPLQTRRKSRANSAPPPPSPIRQMHAQQLIYNPKSRGSRGRQPTHLSPSVPSRQLMFSYTPLHSSSSSSSSPTLTSPELSPDFPKPRNSEEMMPYSSSWPIHFWNSTPPDQQQASSFDYTLLSNQSSAIASLVPSREFGASNGLRMFDEEPFHGFHHEEVHEDQIQQGFLSMGHDDDVPRRRPSVMVNGLGEFPVVPFDHSTAASPTWTLTQEDRPDDLTLALPTDLNALEQFQNPFEKSNQQLEDPSTAAAAAAAYVFLTKDQVERDGLVEKILSAGYGVTYEAS